MADYDLNAIIEEIYASISPSIPDELKDQDNDPIGTLEVLNDRVGMAWDDHEEVTEEDWPGVCDALFFRFKADVERITGQPVDWDAYMASWPKGE